MGQRVFITGGASGLGLALVKYYQQQGWQVAIGDLQTEVGEQVAAELGSGVRFLTCDVTRLTDLQHVARELQESWGGVDLVINNAGVAQVGAIDDVKLSDWEWIININLLGVVRGCQVFTPLFKQQGHGHFVNISSMAGLLDLPNMGSYNATKAAVVSLSETLQNELAPHNIDVTLVCPSFFRTNLGESMRSTVPGMDQTLDRLMAKSELSADDIARQIAQAVANRQFYLLPHKKALRSWRLKRWLPRRWYTRMLQKSLAGHKQKRSKKP